MPRKKKEPIIGISSDPENKLLVQKSNELSVLLRSDMTLAEFKLLDVFLSRINSHDPEHRTVVLSKGQIEEALGVTKLSAKDLSDRLLHIGQGIKVEDLSCKSGFRIVWLLDEAKCELDEYGQWKVTMEASPKAMKYFFNVDTIGYYRYKLHCITGLKSRYTYLMFSYLERNRFRKSWVEDLEELKRLLNCDNEETYKEFKFFNLKILKPIHKELHEKTECRYTYETVKKGRTVTAIRFTLETLPKIEVDLTQIHDKMSLEDSPMIWPDGDPRNLLHEAMPEFSKDEFEQIFLTIQSIPDNRLPDFPLSSLQTRRYAYLEQLQARLNVARQKDAIKHPLKYVLKMIENDLE